MEIIVGLLLLWGGYEHGKSSVEVPSCPSVALSTVECPEIYPPEDESFGATTRSYTSLITTYRSCKKSCVTPIAKP